MSFLSKLFGGDKNAEKAAKDILNGLFNGNPDKTEKKEPQDRPEERVETPRDNGSDGIPAEENQFNFNGTYTEYFEKIFAEELPQYRYEKTCINNRRVVYTFFNGTSKMLVVELMSEKCSARKLRSDCEAEGTPYLRFYYDHEGWWNLRTYVAERLHNAL